MKWQWFQNKKSNPDEHTGVYVPLNQQNLKITNNIGLICNTSRMTRSRYLLAAVGEVKDEISRALL